MARPTTQSQQRQPIVIEPDDENYEFYARKGTIKSSNRDQKPMNTQDVIEQPTAPTPVACSDLFNQSVEYSPLSMVERAVRNARPHRTTEAPRWVAVMDVFGYGSTTSTELCRRFGLDPHEKVQGVKCDCLLGDRLLKRVSRMNGEEIAAAIEASHPMETEEAGVMDADALAMHLVGARHEKRKLVNLVRWLLIGAPNVSDELPPKLNLLSTQDANGG